MFHLVGSKIRLHPENQLHGLPGSALKVSVVCGGVGGWANPLLCLTKLELRLSWAVTISKQILFLMLQYRTHLQCYQDTNNKPV